MKLFSQTLAELRFGESEQELTAKLAELVAAVGNTHKAGKLVFELKVKPGPSGSVQIDDVITLKKPELPKGASLFFADDNNDLQRNDPRQAMLPGLRTVDQSTGEIREVAHG